MLELKSVEGILSFKELAYFMVTLLTAFIAAFFGSFFALRKTKKESAWLQKREAYINIIESLHNIILWADHEAAQIYPCPSPTVRHNEERLVELRASQTTGLDTLRKHVHIGELVLSENAAKQLNELLDEFYCAVMRHWDDPRPDQAIEYGMHGEANDINYKHYDSLKNIAEKHIDKIRVLAKKDLGITTTNK